MSLLVTGKTSEEFQSEIFNTNVGFVTTLKLTQRKHMRPIHLEPLMKQYILAPPPTGAGFHQRSSSSASSKEQNTKERKFNHVALENKNFSPNASSTLNGSSKKRPLREMDANSNYVSYKQSSHQIHMKNYTPKTSTISKAATED
ncbi:hypothetical protein QAD02_017975 [Eretmocerus hayati]|uniref:Uncharacterized protein n=1 Tax=Eretmocerus hayati TaxID=131215 RepID=A0ACC2PGL0_9HYME|nr:hypothetical protein QAD02_017975 [Eretmocerus hayati]